MRPRTRTSPHALSRHTGHLTGPGVTPCHNMCSATRPQSPSSVRRAVVACSSGAFFAPGQVPPAAKGSADSGRASACTLRRKALRRRACAPAAKGSADTNGLRALAVPVKGRDQRHGVRLVELRHGTSWQMLTQSPRQVWAAAVPPAACTPLDTVALSAAGLQSPARGATRRPLAVAAARPNRSRPAPGAESGAPSAAR